MGVSALEISHRSPWFEGVLEEITANLRQLLAIPANYRVLYLQGGSRLQFSMVPMNLLRGTGRSADYIVTGTWGQMAMAEAKREGKVRAAYNSKPTNFDRLPAAGELDLDPQAAYVHFTSNETIQGVEFLEEPAAGRRAAGVRCFERFPVAAAAHREVRADLRAAQKNAGPAGITLVIIRDDLLARSSDDLPSMLNYQLYAEEKSCPTRRRCSPCTSCCW